MASTSETGHAKNVANFEKLITSCSSFGAAYNPANTQIQLASINTLLAASKSAVAAINTTKTAFSNATNARQVAFEALQKLITQVVGALESSGANPKTLADARTIVNKLRGARINKKAPAKTTDAGATPDSKTISVSQVSYDSIIANFSALVTFLTSIPEYKPNENPIKITGLNTTLGNLNTLNSAVISTYTNLDKARYNRNKTLYDPITGLTTIAKYTKAYVKSVFGAKSPEFKQISGLEFKTYK